VGAGIGTAAGLIIGAHQALQGFAVKQRVQQAVQGLQTGNLDEASQGAQFLTKEKDKEVQAVGHYFFACICIAEEDLQGAITHLSDYFRLLEAVNAAQRYRERLAEAYRMRGSIYLERKDLANALRDFTSAIQVAPNNGDSYLLGGQALRNLGELQ
jgi:tetratricopeptide (TPR) repeat protein